MPVIPASEIVARMEAADAARLRAFPGYTGKRSYLVQNTRFGVNATMNVEITVDQEGRKDFKVLESKGPGAVKKMVFQRMLDTEKKASSTITDQKATRISTLNYNFELLETVQMENGRSTYVLAAKPRIESQLLFEGKVWIDATDFAVVKIEGTPAKSPSFWVKKTRFVHQYKKVGGYWVAASNHSENDIRMFGTSTTHIDYTGYQISGPPQVVGQP